MWYFIGILTIKIINQIIKKVGLVVNKHRINPVHNKNKHKDIKII
jgi:hypothetical protein